MNNGYKRFIEENLEIVNKEGKLVPFILNDIQSKFLTEDTTNGRDIIVKARQQGFSSLILGVFLADFLLKENTYNVVIADEAGNATGLLKRVKDYIDTWADKRGLDPKKLFKYNSKYELYFEPMNSTYIIGTAQNINVGRSKTITNLHMSEAAFYPHLDQMLAGVLQAVVPGGRIILETTANGFNFFKEYWDKTDLGETSFTNHFYRASDFYGKEFLAEKEKELGRLYRQEYPETALEAFITSGSTYFDQEALEYYLTNAREPAGGQFVGPNIRQYRDLEHGEHILVAVDTSMGGNDYVAAQFVSRQHLDVPLIYHSKETATVLTNKLPEILERIHDITGIKPTVAYERNNGGAFEMDRIAAMNRNGKYDIFKMPNYGKIDPAQAVKLGWDTNSASRPKMLSELKEAIDKHVIHIYDKPTINEMFAFIVVQTTSSWKAQAEVGAHDDLIMSLAIAWQLYSMVPANVEDVYIPPQDFSSWEI